MKQLYKKHKRLCIFFFVLFIAVYICTFAVSAADSCPYDSWEYDLVKRIEVAGMFSDLIRSAESSILIGLGYIVDEFSNAIDTLLTINLYDGIKNVFNIKTWIYPVAYALFSLAIIIAGIYLMIFPDKLKISNLLKSIMISGCLLVVTPSLFSVMEDIKNAGISDVDSISVTGSSGVKHSIGDELLAAVTVDMRESGKAGKVRYISQTDDFKRKTGICYGLDYNKTLSNTSGNFKWKVTDIDAEESSQKLFSDLTFDDYLYLIGIYDEYTLCKDAKEIYDRISSSGVDKYNATDDEIKNSGGWIFVVYSANTDFFGPATKYIDPYTYYNDYLVPSIVYETSKCDYLKDKEKNAIKKKLLSSNSGGACGIGTAASIYKLNNFEDDKNSAGIETCIRRIIDYLMENGYMEKLNTANNEKEFEKGTTYNYSYVSLHTQEDHDDLGWTDQLMDYLDGDHFGKPIERVYAYDIDFVEGFILMIAVFVSLLFAGLKLARMLFDILFMRVIAPVVFASDLQGGERTKKMLSEIIASFIVIILIFLIIKLYLIVLLWAFSKSLGIIVALLIIIGGAGFVIDGPDIVVKLLGVDAGVKSGHGMLMGAMAGVNLAKNAAKGTVGAVKSAGHIAGKGVGAAKKVGSAIKNNSETINKAASSAAKKLGGVYGAAEKGAANAMSKGSSPALGAVGNVAKTGLKNAGKGISNTAESLGRGIKNTPGKVANSQVAKAFQSGRIGKSLEGGNGTSDVSNTSGSSSKPSACNTSVANSKGISGGSGKLSADNTHGTNGKSNGGSTPITNSTPSANNTSSGNSLQGKSSTPKPNNTSKPNNNPITNNKLQANSSSGSNIKPSAPSPNNSSGKDSKGALYNVTPPVNNANKNNSGINNNSMNESGKEK